MLTIENMIANNVPINIENRGMIKILFLDMLK